MTTSVAPGDVNVLNRLLNVVAGVKKLQKRQNLFTGVRYIHRAGTPPDVLRMGW